MEGRRIEPKARGRNEPMRDRTTFRPRAVAALGWLWVVTIGAGPQSGLTPADDLTFRPSVIVRKGLGQGTGTIIASTDGETLILTAAHVVNEPGLLGVEVHRYNLGVERSIRRGGWPVTIAAEVAASDDAADVAVVRVRGRPAFPFVARLAAPGDEPKSGAVVTSVGVDGGASSKAGRRPSATSSGSPTSPSPRRPNRHAARPPCTGPAPHQKAGPTPPRRSTRASARS